MATPHNPDATRRDPCRCINCTAARDFFGPAVITPRSILDTGEHKRELWQMPLNDTERSRANEGRARTTRPSRPVVVRDRHPFGYKKSKRVWAVFA